MPTLEPVTVPLQPDAAGALRIADTRVLLELIVRAFRAGATPEKIVHAFDTLRLPDVDRLRSGVLVGCDKEASRPLAHHGPMRENGVPSRLVSRLSHRTISKSPVSILDVVLFRRHSQFYLSLQFVQEY